MDIRAYLFFHDSDTLRTILSIPIALQINISFVKVTSEPFNQIIKFME